MKEHEQILKAIESMNADATEKAARKHIQNAQLARLEMLFQVD